MPAILRYNPESDLYGGELPDGCLFGPEEYDDDATELIFDDAGKAYLAAFDEASDTEGLADNTIYQLSPTSTDLGFVPHTDDDDSVVAHDGGTHYLVTFNPPPEGLEPDSTYELIPMETTVETDFDFETSELYAEDEEDEDDEVDVDEDDEEA